MGKRYASVLFVVMVAAVLFCYAVPNAQAGGCLQKVDNFLVILDASGSMGEEYKGDTKLTLAKETVSNMNQKIPDIKLKGALRRFGRDLRAYQQRTALLYAMAEYERDGFGEAVTGLKRNLGESPLALAMDAAGGDLQSVQGDMALIIVSDGKDMDDAPVMTAKRLKCQYAERLCIYTVQVGDCPAGKELLERIADAGHCGFSINADDIASDQGMANFVDGVFCLKGERDSDGDGVVDSKDKCPNTIRGAKVNKVGCWVVKGINFSTDKADVRPQDYAGLDEVVVVLKENPTIKVEIQGHTDNTGTEEYNQGLSQRRADAVKAYFVEKGIAEDRLSTIGYGESKPVDTNDTVEGRFQNRRVQLKVIE
jgi:OOP family OmpA-OmpF porin